jgi:hypothetical protein
MIESRSSRFQKLVSAVCYRFDKLSANGLRTMNHPHSTISLRNSRISSSVTPPPTRYSRTLP